MADSEFAKMGLILAHLKGRREVFYREVLHPQAPHGLAKPIASGNSFPPRILRIARCFKRKLAAFP